jgi:hypothetical protein
MHTRSFGALAPPPFARRSAILGPLDVRQAAVRALTGRGCGCARCAAEATLPEALRRQLAELRERLESEWTAALNAAAAAGDEDALDALWVRGWRARRGALVAVAVEGLSQGFGLLQRDARAIQAHGRRL